MQNIYCIFSDNPIELGSTRGPWIWPQVTHHPASLYISFYFFFLQSIDLLLTYLEHYTVITTRIESIREKKRNKYYSIVFKRGLIWDLAIEIGVARFLEWLLKTRGANLKWFKDSSTKEWKNCQKGFEEILLLNFLFSYILLLSIYSFNCCRFLLLFYLIMDKLKSLLFYIGKSFSNLRIENRIFLRVIHTIFLQGKSWN